MIIFKQAGEKTEVAVSIDGDSNINDVIEAFTGFLYACGYSPLSIQEYFGEPKE
jgi:hypothetical protein